MIGDDPPRSAAWGYCNRDYPRAGIVSPYGFKTAQAHYEALLEETRRRGGPTQHTYATVPGELERPLLVAPGTELVRGAALESGAHHPVAAHR